MIDPILIPIFGVMIPIVVVPCSLLFKYYKYQRECEHKERMKAFEVGRTLPIDEPWWSPSKTIVAIGAGVPIAVFGLAWMTTLTTHADEVVWVGAGMVGFTSVLCGSFLASKEFARRARSEADTRALHEKSYLDADAYDVAGSRG